MQRRFNSSNDARRDLFEASRVTDLFHRVAQDALRIVPFAEEPPVQGIQPWFAARVQKQRKPTQHNINPTSRTQNLDKRLLAVECKVEYEYRRQNRHHAKHRAARERVLQALPDDDLDIKGSVTNDGVIEREWAGEKQNQPTLPHPHVFERECFSDEVEGPDEK